MFLSIIDQLELLTLNAEMESNVGSIVPKAPAVPKSKAPKVAASKTVKSSKLKPSKQNKYLNKYGDPVGSGDTSKYSPGQTYGGTFETDPREYKALLKEAAKHKPGEWY